MSKSTVDWLVAIPMIPAIPIIATWYLPWERWIPWGKLPKSAMGPYLIYGAFAAWHFRLPWFVIFAAVTAGGVVTIWAVVERLQKSREEQTSDARFTP